MQKRAIAIFLILLMLVGAFACKGEQTPAQTAAMIGRTIFFMFTLSFTIFQTGGS